MGHHDTDEWPAKSKYEYDPSREQDTIPNAVWGAIAMTIAFPMTLAALSEGQFPVFWTLLGVGGFLCIYFDSPLLVFLPHAVQTFLAICIRIAFELGVVG